MAEGGGLEPQALRPALLSRQPRRACPVHPPRNLNGGRCWLRTNDLLGVGQALWPAELTVHIDRVVKDRLSTDPLPSPSRHFPSGCSPTQKARACHPGPFTLVGSRLRMAQGGCALTFVLLTPSAGIATPRPAVRDSCSRTANPRRNDRQMPSSCCLRECIAVATLLNDVVCLNEKGPGSRSWAPASGFPGFMDRRGSPVRCRRTN